MNDKREDRRMNDQQDSLLADLDLIWHSTSDTRETNEALDRIKAALSVTPPAEAQVVDGGAVDWDAYQIIDQFLQCANVGRHDGKLLAAAKDWVSQQDAALSAQPRQEEATLKWAVDRWHDEVASRPMVNVHRPALDGTWRQVIRHFGGDDVLLCGPDHYARHALEAAGAVS